MLAHVVDLSISTDGPAVAFRSGRGCFLDLVDYDTRRSFMRYPHKNIRLEPQRYVGLATHFITICCDGRHPVFANGGRAAWFVDVLRRISRERRFAVHAYCVMPDHFHMLVSGIDEGS